MLINLVVFAEVKEVLGRGELLLDLEPGATVADAYSYLVSQYPEVSRYKSCLKMAVDQEFVGFEALLPEGCELALFTPVGGG